ncbi:hypothetical protein CONPUDRAFT_163631 [Coniophora puteana RWD-64-598 SS2]|uniref:F-box domain-containing protein n=1 Tax=Coniophora puteana (strain RWD-64-598) TaxID=741705 RepID=A0A5M3MZF8_CONPW|nr:uncharacterized protein CONPUDRAFT_163631 [Coniophora puteana RWD-64-598 SS2]EIW84532.1 hypothetical protein CONPUDRAFT_163631 [Coniophora puteana RWD-64-598 SS2]
MAYIIEEVNTEMLSASAALQAIAKLLPDLASDVSNAINTPYASYAKTNYSVPTEEERREIRPMISAISLMMADMQAISDTLVSFYKMSLQARKSYLRLVSPVGRIPPELLSKIFIRSARKAKSLLPPPEARIPYIRHHKKAKISPTGYLNVAKVCRRWRDVALSTPRLWTRLEIAPIDRDMWKSQTLLTSFPLPVEPLIRAMGLPTFLTLDLRGTSLIQDTKVDYLPVNPACNSVRAIDIVRSCCTLSILELFQWLSQFGNLTHLLLDNIGIDVRSEVGFDQEWPPAGLPSLFFDRLTHLHVRTDMIYQVEEFCSTRTWGNLRSLTLDMYDGSEVWCTILEVIFDHLPNLVELWIAEDAVEEGGVGHWDSTHITSTKMRVFSLTVDRQYLPDEGYAMDPLFGSLNLPALTDLVVTCPLEGDVEFLRGFLIRSRCQLSSLTFTDVPDQDLTDAESSLIHQAGTGLGEEFHIQCVTYTRTLKEARVFREAKNSWYGVGAR